MSVEGRAPLDSPPELSHSALCIFLREGMMRVLALAGVGLRFRAGGARNVRRPFRIEGYAIASADGMIADSTGLMPGSLKFEADQRFFLGALERSAVIAHGRLSHEGDADSHTRRRLILTRRVSGLKRDPANPNTWLWNPAGATLEEARAAVACGDGAMAIAGGTEVFSLFLKIGYDVFYLAHASDVRLPGGVPVFSQGRFGQRPEDVLRAAGLKPAEPEPLEDGVSLVRWTA